MRFFIAGLLCFLLSNARAQVQTFRFAFLSDTHIGSPDGKAEEDLRRTVADINGRTDIAFVVLTGDITELGTDAQLALAKRILDSLHVPWYIIPGNHDTGWSESGGQSFTRIFGSDRFFFSYGGLNFIGCASGPYVRMSDGHVPRDAMNWLKEKLDSLPPSAPLVFLNHYPLDNGLDNWYEVIGLLKQKNTVLALCGHGHNNRPVQAEGIPSVMGRSNLRAKAPEGGYNLVDVRSDSFLFTERRPLTGTEQTWTAVANTPHQYTHTGGYPRPDFSMNDSFHAQVQPQWTYASAANIISTPAVSGKLVVFGNGTGTVEGLDLETGARKWSFRSGGPVFSSPVASKDRFVFGSADSFVYCLDGKGKLRWKFRTGASVLGAALIEGDRVYIGGSDHCFRALSLKNGRELWKFEGLGGPVFSRATIAGDRIVFGAWDRNLYALDKNTGRRLWSWNNGSTVINYSPAACIPAIRDGVVYIAAPDRFLTALDLNTGEVLWRTNRSAVRESIGLSEDGTRVYGKTIQDSLVAFRTGREGPILAWKVSAGFGYEHAPSMPVERGGSLFFGTRNGVVYCLSPQDGARRWSYKIDNSMVNTVCPLGDGRVLASTMDGKVCLLRSTGVPGPPAKE